MIRTIIFDLGGVLVPLDTARGYAALERLSGHPAEEIRNRLASTDLVRRLETGTIEPREFVRQISAHLGVQASYEQFCELWSCIFLPHELIPDAVVEWLRRHYRLLLLSNTNALHFDAIVASYPVLRHFDEMVLSHRVGALKPAPEIYRHAISSAGCSAAECLFIDDLPTNVAGAIAQGMEAVQFETWEKLAVDLRARGIRWD